MAGKSRNSDNAREDIVDLLLRMEPELRLLEGVVVTLRSLSETAESIGPVALAMLAHTSGEALDELTDTWKGLRVAVGPGSVARKNL